MLYHKMYFLVKFLDLIVSFTSEWLFFKSKYSKTKKKNSTKDENTKLFLSYFLLNNNNPPPPSRKKTPPLKWFEFAKLWQYMCTNIGILHLHCFTLI